MRISYELFVVVSIFVASKLEVFCSLGAVFHQPHEGVGRKFI
jgi:hypothetical protein